MANDTKPGVRAIATGQDMTALYFQGRKGHGGTEPATYVVLRPAKLGAMLALAYQRGRDEAKLPELKINGGG